MASPASSIPDTQLGLSNDEIRLLRHHQQAAAAGSTAGNSSSSRAASRASSQGHLLLDSASLQQLSRHFDRLMQQISERIEHLSDQAAAVAQHQYDRAGNAIAMADAQIARLNSINAQLDELEDDFDRITRIKDVVRSFRQRVEQMERELESSSSSRREHRHRHGESSTGRHRQRPRH